MSGQQNADPWTADRLTVAPATWLQVLREEYLTDYLASGGTAVKFVSGAPDVLSSTRREILESAQSSGYWAAELDPGLLTSEGRKPDLHRIERFFFSATRGVDWRAFSDRQAREFLRELGIRVPADRSLREFEQIAAENGRDPNDLVREYQQRIATRMIRDKAMEYEFRAAVTALGRSQIWPDVMTPTTEEVLLAWFSGRTLPGAAAALKKIQIFERINATNARHMLTSFCRWLPMVGLRGLVLVLDLRPYERKQRGQAQRFGDLKRQLSESVTTGLSAEEVQRLLESAEFRLAVSYSDSGYYAMLALLRRFIDEIHHFERFLLVVLTSPEFYDEASPRNYFNYDALQTRIGLEVRDAHRANPAAALVHLGGMS